MCIFFGVRSDGTSRAVIASQRVREAPPDDRLREAIQSFSDQDWRSEALDCFVASAPRNDEEAAAQHTQSVILRSRACCAASRRMAAGALLTDPSRLAAVRRAPQDDGCWLIGFSAARCTPRPASARDFRGCRPAHRPPRRRRRRGKYFPAARSSCRHCRSSRRPSADYAPRCNR